MIMHNKSLFALLVGGILLGVAPLVACAPAGGMNGVRAAVTPSPPRVQTVRNTAQSAPRPAISRPPKIPPTPNPDLLLGLDTAQVEELLGNADLRRSEPPAQVWQYESRQCVLHLFLYENGGEYRVEYYETRDPVGAPNAGGVCLAALLNGHGRAGRIAN